MTLAGCTVVGPRAVLSGRMAYNEAIVETNNQQMLMVFVHNRYEQTNHLLSVSSVTANVSVSSSAQFQAGIGSSDNYEGNLVPFSGGFVYEENPTISYTPVAGETYLRQLMSPLPLSDAVAIIQSLPHPELAYYMLIASVNGIGNPAFLYDKRHGDPRFERFVGLMVGLGREQCIYWPTGQEVPKATIMQVRSSEACAGPLAELLGLLGVAVPIQPGEQVSVPVTHMHGSESPAGVAINTRTIWNLVEILSAAVEVPPEDESNGVAASFPKRGGMVDELRIRYSSDRPEAAYVVIQHRDGWFYIDDGDLVTKRYFKLLASLWSAAMSKSLIDNSSAPVLTVPVSG